MSNLLYIRGLLLFLFTIYLKKIEKLNRSAAQSHVFTHLFRVFYLTLQMEILMCTL